MANNKEVDNLTISQKSNRFRFVVLFVGIAVFLAYYFFWASNNTGFTFSSGISDGGEDLRSLLNIGQSQRLFDLVSYPAAFLGKNWASAGWYQLSYVVAYWLPWWLLAAFVGLVLAAFTPLGHVGKDLLGSTGNGRVFFSGVNATLDGELPSSYVCSLAALNRSSAGSDRIMELLKQYKAENPLNIAMAETFAAYPELPLFIGSDTTLISGTADALGDVLAFHKGEEGSGAYVAALQRLLAADLLKVFKDVPSAIIASVVLATELGKIMAFAKEGGAWRQTSLFPLLSSRAALMSFAEFGSCYSADERTDIRQAIMYGELDGAVSSQRLPNNISGRALALRQVVALLSVPPNNLQYGVDQIELFTIIREANKRFVQDFIPKLQASSYSFELLAFGNVIFMPISYLVGMLSELLPQGFEERLTVLHKFVHKQSTLQTLSRSDAGQMQQNDANLALAIPPIMTEQLEKTASAHNTTTDLVARWSSLRLILDYSGLIATRVADYSADNDGVISLAYTLDGRLQVEQASAVVPVRAHIVEQRLGSEWRSHFGQISRLVVADSVAELADYLSGKRDLALPLLSSDAIEVSDG